MRIIADENIAGIVVRGLRQTGHNVLWIAETASGEIDDVVLERAIAEKRMLLTSDVAFASEVAKLARQSFFGVFLVRQGDLSNAEIAEIICRVLAGRGDWHDLSAVLKGRNLRVRERPAP
jgi:predicted nuclease of predicted toxin-antitoxin system